MTLIGFAAAWWVYIANEGMGARIAARKGPIWSFLYNKWYFDELYDATFVRGARMLGDLFWKGGDQTLIDGLGVWIAGAGGLDSVINGVGGPVGSTRPGKTVPVDVASYHP